MTRKRCIDCNELVMKCDCSGGPKSYGKQHLTPELKSDMEMAVRALPPDVQAVLDSIRRPR